MTKEFFKTVKTFLTLTIGFYYGDSNPGTPSSSLELKIARIYSFGKHLQRAGSAASLLTAYPARSVCHSDRPRVESYDELGWHHSL